MNIEEIRTTLGWCSLINIILLLIWFVMLVTARDWIHRLHGKWFRLPPEKLDAIHYRIMGQYKMLVYLFNIVPYIALHIAF